MATESFHPFRSEQAREEFLSFYLEKAKRWPIPSETRLFDTASGMTFVRISGKASDPPLVLLPGARGSSLMWIPNIAALSSAVSSPIDISVPLQFPLSPQRFSSAMAPPGSCPGTGKLQA
jgi:hypothetical protein